MIFSVCLAADFEGEKVNFLLSFDSYAPTVAQVLTRGIEIMNRYFQSRGLSQPFTVTTAVIFNENNQTWDRLERSTQLVHYGQIYLFQSDVIDVPAEIPDPIDAFPYLQYYESPQRHVGAYESPRARLPVANRPYEATNYTSPAYASPYRARGDGGSPIPNRGYVPSYASDYPRQPQQGYVPTSVSPRRERPHFADIEGESIIQNERRRLAAQAHLNLDEYRDEVHSEARGFSASPERVARQPAPTESF